MEKEKGNNAPEAKKPVRRKKTQSQAKAPAQPEKTRELKPNNTKKKNVKPADKSVEKKAQSVEKSAKPAQKKAQPEAKKRQGERRGARSGGTVIPKLLESAKLKSDAPLRRVTGKDGETLRIIPLGGIGEIGKNMTVIEYGEDIIVIDCGLIFPREDMLGIDYIIPDVSYLEKNAEKVKAFFITHGHEDHIGGTPYILPKFKAPVYGTEFSLLLIEAKRLEHEFEMDAKVLNPGQSVNVGCFTVEAIKVNHSIDGALAYAIHTPVGVVVHTGDFKIDYTPTDGVTTDLAKFAKLGASGVLALLSDSTNAETPGYTMSESLVAHTFDSCFKAAKGRVIVATFSSNVHRVQQVADACREYGRKLAFAGRSMVKIAGIAREYGYLKIDDDVIIDVNDVGKYPKDRVAVVTTGSQGEPMSGLVRMAAGEHQKVTVEPGDMVIVSASPIPGNERYVGDVINMLYRKGAQVVSEDQADVHVSGHACAEEEKLILSLTRPRYFMPVHGEYRHLYTHAATAKKLGIPEKNIFLTEIGKVLAFNRRTAYFDGSVESGSVLIDGLGVGDVGEVVLRDRKVLSQDGLVIAIAMVDKETGVLLSEPEIISRGFVYVKESEDLMEAARKLAYEAVTSARETDRQEVKRRIKKALREMLYEETQRSPMILPVVIEV